MKNYEPAKGTYLDENGDVRQYLKDDEEQEDLFLHQSSDYPQLDLATSNPNDNYQQVSHNNDQNFLDPENFMQISQKQQPQMQEEQKNDDQNNQPKNEWRFQGLFNQQNQQQEQKDLQPSTQNNQNASVPGILKKKGMQKKQRINGDLDPMYTTQTTLNTGNFTQDVEILPSQTTELTVKQLIRKVYNELNQYCKQSLNSQRTSAQLQNDDLYKSYGAFIKSQQSFNQTTLLDITADYFVVAANPSNKMNSKIFEDWVAKINSSKQMVNQEEFLKLSLPDQAATISEFNKINCSFVVKILDNFPQTRVKLVKILDVVDQFAAQPVNKKQNK